MFKSLNEHPLFKLRSESIQNDEDRQPQNKISNQSQLIKKQNNNNNVFISFDELYKPVDGPQTQTIIKSKQAQQNLIPPTASLARSNENLLAVKIKNSIKQKSSSVSNLNETSIINSQNEPENEFNMNMIESNYNDNNVHAKSTENLNANFSKSLRLNGYLTPVDRDDEQTFPFPLPVDSNLIKSKTDLSLNESLDDSSASSSSQKTPFYVNSNHDYLVSGVEFLFCFFFFTWHFTFTWKVIKNLVLFIHVFF